MSNLHAYLFLCLVAGCASAPLAPAAMEHNAAGTRLLAAGALDDAEARFRIALEYHPRFSEAHNNLGLVFLARGDVDTAIDHFRDAIELNEDFVEAHTNLGVALERRGDETGAISAYRAALAIDPGVPEPRRDLALLHARRGELRDSRAQLLRYVQIAPSDARALGLLAYCELRLGRREAARARAGDALRIEPGSSTARLTRGVLAFFDGELDAARTDLEAARADPLVAAHASLRLAVIDLAQGDRAGAAERIDALLASGHRDPALRLVADRVITDARPQQRSVASARGPGRAPARSPP